jgi:hypothetical protein
MHTIELLRQFPDILREVVARVPGELMRTRSRDGEFSLVEHAWHLADLEEEGYALRIRRLLEEERPRLADFEGDAIAQQRRYIEKPVGPAVERFALQRRSNAERLAQLQHFHWQRAGVQDGVGDVTLARLPAMMLAHDLEHACDLVELLGELGVAPDGELVRFASAKRSVPGI